jgi:ubiquinone/menaquinone biosynthesis C-methylase UbiE
MSDHQHDHDHDHDSDHGAGGHLHDPAHFDELAKTWDDDPMKVERARVVAARIVQRLAPTNATSLFEYGAGTGLVAQHLSTDVGPITLADNSPGMRDAMAAKVATGDLPADARIWSVDLASDPAPAERFDLVVTVQVLHHVHDLPTVLAAFAQITEPGGHLCVVDLEEEDGSFHGEGFGGHQGFHRATLADQITAAGFTDVTFEHAYDLTKDGHDYPLFLAIATR